VRHASIEGIGLSQEGAGDLDAAKKTFTSSQIRTPPRRARSASTTRRASRKRGRDRQGEGPLIAALKKITDSKIEQVYVEQVARELLGSIDPRRVRRRRPMSLTKERAARAIEKARSRRADAEGARQAQGLPKTAQKEAT
jgi:hypothetical protein